MTLCRISEPAVLNAARLSARDCPLVLDEQAAAAVTLPAAAEVSSAHQPEQRDGIATRHRSESDASLDDTSSERLGARQGAMFVEVANACSGHARVLISAAATQERQQQQQQQQDADGVVSYSYRRQLFQVQSGPRCRWPLSNEQAICLSCILLHADAPSCGKTELSRVPYPRVL